MPRGRRGAYSNQMRQTTTGRGRRAPSAEAYLGARTRLGIKFGLAGIRALTAALGHPERAYPCLLVAGTNGKGSVVAYVDAVLRASGLRVGRYTSPHLLRVNERITVAGREISQAKLEAAVTRVRQAADRLVGAGRLSDHPTYFEAVTAAAFDHFRRERVEVAVLEVGMGGRLDATNVCRPLASAIVSIARDHEAYLGHSLAAIAREKAGVLRQGRVTVLGPLPASARRAVAREAGRLGATLVEARHGVRTRENARSFDLVTPGCTYRHLRPLPGRHQRDNLLVALRLLEAAAAAGLPVDLARASGAIANTRWPGRLQWIPGRPRLLLDGAHNPAGAKALAEYLRPRGPFVLVFGAMSDKDLAELAGVLFPPADSVVLTRAPLERAATPEEIVVRAGAPARRAYREADPAKALALARRLAGRERFVVVAGSLYLVGEVLKQLEGKPRPGPPRVQSAP